MTKEKLSVCLLNDSFPPVIDGVANAVLSCDLAMAGIPSLIPFDEVVDAMRAVGAVMSPDLKETARGGLAATETARRLEKTIQ